MKWKIGIHQNQTRLFDLWVIKDFFCLQKIATNQNSKFVSKLNTALIISFRNLIILFNLLLTKKAKLHFLKYLIFIVLDQIKVHTLVMMIQVFHIIPYCLQGKYSHAQAQDD